MAREDKEESVTEGQAKEGGNSRYIRESDKEQLWELAAGRCSFWDPVDTPTTCCELLKYEDVFVGEHAHILPHGENGPRSKERSTGKPDNSYGNLILLCHKHHRFVDDKEISQFYSRARLLDMKKVHEQRMLDEGFRYEEGNIEAKHDYAMVSEFFRFVNIRTLKLAVRDFPNIHDSFFNMADAIILFRGIFPNWVVTTGLRCSSGLWGRYRLKLFDSDLSNRLMRWVESYRVLRGHFSKLWPESVTPIPESHRGKKYEDLILHFGPAHEEKVSRAHKEYLESTEALVTIVERRFHKVMSQDVHFGMSRELTEPQKKKLKETYLHIDRNLERFDRWGNPKQRPNPS